MNLEIKDIVKSFSGKEILHGINFSVQSGRAMGFLGRNGAGKTTTFRCLMDVFKQDSGQFVLDGQLFNHNNNKIGYLPEERGLYYKVNVLDQLVYFGQLRGGTKQESTESALYWIDYFGLNDYKDKHLETLSKGNQQKIQIAQAFLNDPDILILDEPFSGLDPVNSQIFKEAIRTFVQKGKLVIFSSHQMSYVEEMCDDITLIHHGNILLSGDLKQIKREKGLNKFFIAGTHFESVNEIILNEYPTFVISTFDDRLVVDTKNEINLNEFIQLLINNHIDFTQVGYYEPSLQDIFVEMVGEKE